MSAPPKSVRWVVSGLGNPGPTYSGTRHNVGARSVSLLADRWGVKLRLQGDVAWGAAESGDTTAFLVLPQTYMNDSGRALAPFAKNRNVPPERLLVVVDDLDLPPGRIRVRPSGSSGGHHGLDSILQHLGSDAFPRIRIGVGKPPRPDLGADWVLSGFRPEEKPVVEDSLARAADCAVKILEEGVEAAMRAYNGPAPGPGGLR